MRAMEDEGMGDGRLWRGRGKNYAVVCEQRQSLLQPPLRMYISADEPCEEEGEEEGKDDVFCDLAFLVDVSDDALL
jgi:hypothetical protein